jgi:hypothetical protein
VAHLFCTRPGKVSCSHALRIVTLLDREQRFKNRLQVSFPELLQLYWPSWAEHFDFNTLTWPSQAIFKYRQDTCSVDSYARGQFVWSSEVWCCVEPRLDAWYNPARGQ